MSHAAEHPNPNPHDDPSAQPLVFVTVIGVIIFLATVFFVAAATWQFKQTTVDEVFTDVPNTAVAELNSQQTQSITGAPRWIDPAGGKVAIPIDRAIQLVEAELKAGGGAATKGP